MPPRRLKRNIDYLSVLKRASKEQQNAILSTADQDLLLCLCECALNVLNGNVPLSNSDLKKLTRYKTALRTLANKEASLQDKQRLLLVQNQRGGFLPILLAPILGFAGQLLAETISK